MTPSHAPDLVLLLIGVIMTFAVRQLLQLRGPFRSWLAISAVTLVGIAALLFAGWQAHLSALRICVDFVIAAAGTLLAFVVAAKVKAGEDLDL